MSMKYISNLKEYLKEQIDSNIIEEFKDALSDLATLDLEDDQVRYPRFDPDELGFLFGANYYWLYLINRDKLPSSGAFEMIILGDDDETIGFIRGTKSNETISFNLIHIKEEYRGKGIGTDIYEKLLNSGYTMKSDDEITYATYSMYERLLMSGYKPIIYDDGRVGLKK